MSDDSDYEDVDTGEMWRIEEVDTDSEIYTFVGRHTPPSNSAVAKAKQQFARKNDYKYRHVVGKKLDDNRLSRSLGAIVVVAHRPSKASNEVI